MKTSSSRPRTAVIVPFKDPSGAKRRLAEFLSADQRHRLAVTLFDETMTMLSALASAPDLLVVTNGAEIAERARRAGAAVLMEGGEDGETAAVERATRWVVERGYDRQVVIPADMAALDPEDVEALLALEISAPSVVLCPAVNDDGTNAIMTSPPDILRFRFGKASFPEYLLRAAENGVTARVLRLKSFVLDLDTPEDLATFLASGIANRASALLREWIPVDKIPVS